MKTILILIFCLLATPVMADTYILTIVPEAELNTYVTNANAWQTEKVHAEVVNKNKMPKYTKDGKNFFISCMPATYFKGKAVSDSLMTAEATKSRVTIVKTENPSEWLNKEGYKAPEMNIGNK